MANPTAFQKLKDWAFPVVITGLATMIYHDITEMRTDIKTLISQGSADHARIDNLERQIYKATTYNYPSMPPTEEPAMLTRVALVPENKLKAKPVKL
jgi:hypothetical protein